MTLFRTLTSLSLGAVVCMIATAAPPRQAITTSQVADAVTGAGLRTAAEQVQMLSVVTAARADAGLKVESMEPMGGGDFRVRLSCVDRAECLPFYVMVRRTSLDTVSAPAPIKVYERSITHPSDQPKVPGGAVAMPSGSAALLFIDNGPVHIRLAVVSLEAGSVGKIIRVISKDRKTTYMAQVESTTTLRGRL